VLDPEQKFLGINERHALVLVVERKQCHVVRRGDLEEKIDLRRDRNRPQEMIGAPQQAGVHRGAASDCVHLVDETDRLGRLVDDPGVSRGFHLAKIGDVVVVRQVNHQRVDRHGSQSPAAFHASALPSKADILVRADHVRFVPKADILGHLIFISPLYRCWIFRLEFLCPYLHIIRSICLQPSEQFNSAVRS